LFVSNSQVIGCKDRLQNDLYCVRWGVKLYSTELNSPDFTLPSLRWLSDSYRLGLYWTQV